MNKIENCSLRKSEGTREREERKIKLIKYEFRRKGFLLQPPLVQTLMKLRCRAFKPITKWSNAGCKTFGKHLLNSFKIKCLLIFPKIQTQIKFFLDIRKLFSLKYFFTDNYSDFFFFLGSGIRGDSYHF